jgi:glycerol kinase
MILGIDQGTTGTTAIIMDLNGRVRARATTAVVQHYPQPGWVEHDPEQIWKSVQGAVTKAIKLAKIKPSRLQAVGLTNQRETVTLFSGTRPLHRFIVWQDRRTKELCDRLQEHEDVLIKRAGLPVDPYFSATKIKWLIDKLKPSLNDKSLRFRTIDSFLLSRLCGADVIEATNASRTSLMNLSTCQWDPELFALFSLPRSIAPQIVSSQPEDLRTRGLKFLPDGIPVTGVLGDQQAALFGQMGWSAGLGKMTYGTGSFVLLHTGNQPVESRQRLVSTLALLPASGRPTYALEGSVFVCGAWIQWMRDQLGFFKKSHQSEALARKTKDPAGVFVVPALTGLGAPFWKSSMRGSILGLTRGSSRAHLARASLEALCFQNRALIDAMIADAQGTLKSVQDGWRVDGGASSNNLLMQIQSDTLKSALVRPKNIEATATGAALLAGLGYNLMTQEKVEGSWKKERIFSPTQDSVALQQRYQEWLHWIKILSANN